MRHIRRFNPASDGFCHPSQQLQAIKSSITWMYLESSEASSSLRGSNIKWRGRSDATSASSDTLEERKPRRRISKDERKSMLENYVKKYAELNEGKFPSPSDARKSLGGSYYYVRKILQELEYNSRLAVVDDKRSVSLEKSSVPKSSVSVQSDKSKVTGSKRRLRRDPENNVEQIQHKPEIQESTESEISVREFHKTPAEDQEPQRISSLWQNLRSFANSVLGIWK